MLRARQGAHAAAAAAERGVPGVPLVLQPRQGANASVSRRELFRGLAAEDDVVLAVFSQPFKIDARVLSVWVHALLAAPTGVYADGC
jgi:hypothetical protein